MRHTIEDVIRGDIDQVPISGNSIDELWFSDNSAGVYIASDDRRIIFAEESEYNPMSLVRFNPDLGPQDTAPFCTDGRQVILDLDRQEFGVREIYYEEGSVQGLVYALDAIRYGGAMDTLEYQQLILEWASEFPRVNDEMPTRLSKGAINKYVKLGLIEMESLRS